MVDSALVAAGSKTNMEAKQSRNASGPPDLKKACAQILSRIGWKSASGEKSVACYRR
jgi:hypothetical protein